MEKSFPVCFLRNAVEVEGASQQVHLSRKKSYPWGLTDVKCLHDFKKVAEPIHARQKSTMCIKCTGGPVP